VDVWGRERKREWRSLKEGLSEKELKESEATMINRKGWLRIGVW